MPDITLTKEMKRNAVLVAIASNRSDLQIARFFNVARSFVFKVRNQLQASDGDVSSVAKRKKHLRRSDVRTDEFIQRVFEIIKNEPSKSIRAIAKQLNVADATIRRVVHKDITYNSDLSDAADVKPFMVEHSQETICNSTNEVAQLDQL